MNARYASLVSIPAAFALGAVAARGWLSHAPSSLARDLAQPLPVVTAWGGYGAVSFALLGAVVLWSAAATLVAVRFAGAVPAQAGTAAVLATTALALAASGAWPFVFSSDVYAYAAYGDMALKGLDPYALVPAGAHDAVIEAARAQWSGSFPVCIYGPLFLAGARIATAAGEGYGVAATLGIFRAAACAAFLASVACLSAALAGLPAGRRFTALCAYGANPVLIWSAAEGHNDAYVALAACGAALLWRRKRGLSAVFLVALTPVVKASGAVLALAATLEAALVARLGIARTLFAAGTGTALALALALPPLLPALATVGARGKYEPASLQALTGPWLAAAIASAAGACALGQLARGRREGLAWLGIAVVVALPNVYPWYGLWLAPLAVAAGGGYAAAALWGATILSVVRYLPDAAGHLSGNSVRLAAALGALPLALAAQPLALALARRSGLRKKAPVQP